MKSCKTVLLSLLAVIFLAGGARALTTGRHGHTTTLLPNGDLLATGGTGGTGNGSLSSVEQYYMASSGWGTHPLGIGGGPNARSSHTATLMADGNVLVAGGYTNGTAQNNAYVYVSSASIWRGPFTFAGGLSRAGHTATLLNRGSYSGNVLLCGGENSAHAILETCEMYISSASSFLTRTSMSSKRLGHAAVSTAGGRVFVSGGVNGAGTYLPTNEIYDPELNQWQTVAALLQGRTEHTLTALNNGVIMVAGGYNQYHDIYTCKAGGSVTDDECWYMERVLEYQDDVGDTDRQDVRRINRYLGAAEFFDQNGGRVALSGLDKGVAPYRYTKHASLLLPDGTHQTLGGYGSIPPTYFSANPKLPLGSSITATAFGAPNYTFAHVGAGSGIHLPLAFDLSRKVDGRLVDADLFISKPVDDPLPPHLAIGNASVFLDFSTATADGKAVGKLLGLGYKPGNFDATVMLRSPTGFIEFEPEPLSGKSADATPTSQFTLSKASVLGGESARVTNGSLTVPLTLAVSKRFLNGTITGRMKLTGGTINVSSSFTITIEGSGYTNFSAVANTLSTDGNSAEFTVPAAAFGSLTGAFVNNSTEPISSPVTLPASAMLSQPVVFAEYISTLIDASEASFAMDVSTAVVREMIFSDDLAYSPADNTWSINPEPMSFPMFNHSAVLTPAADMIVVGGRNCENNPPIDCRRAVKTFAAQKKETGYIHYSDKAWTPTSGKLNTRRAFHTTTLLPDRRVLVCGGSDGETTLSSCELLDPEKKTWSKTAPMNFPRAKHTATLLPNGTVLVAGGTINTSTYVVKTAEIFYPASNRWSLTGEMAVPRANHTATMLPTGNVLVAGGNTINGYTDTSEIFFSTMALWVAPIGASPTMAEGRAQHTATLLKTGNVLVTGGVDGNGPKRSCQVYNYATQTWGATYNMNDWRYGHTATLLRDGRVLAAGGSNSVMSLNTFETFNGTTWSKYYVGLPPVEVTMYYNRTGHSATLLPNGKVMLVGGETGGTVQGMAESYDPDFPNWKKQGLVTSRSNHSAVLTSSGDVLAVGGWNGSGYLDTAESRYFSYYFDVSGSSPTDKRNPLITSNNTYFDRASTITLLSGTTNFHGITEASGGGSGSANSSYHNPRVYLHAVDQFSGFMVDITTAIYATRLNPSWEKTTSSITVLTPGSPGSLPYGYYHVRVADNAQFSHGQLVQVTMPRPVGLPAKPAPPLSETYWRGTTTMTWILGYGTLNSGLAEINGYAIYASSSGVFLDTAAYVDQTTYTLTGVSSNTEASLKVAAYNMGGEGELAYSATYFTLAAPPTNLTVTKSEFNSAYLEWSPNGNAPHTVYQVTMCPGAGCFGNPVLVSTQIAFDSYYTSTAAVISGLSPSVVYYFRVQAQNGKAPDFTVGMGGIKTDYSNEVSTLTAGSIKNLIGSAISTGTISWSWKASTGSLISFEYTVYDVSAGTENPVFVHSSATPVGADITSYSRSGLAPNKSYLLKVRSVYTSGGQLYGPLATSEKTFTFAADPTPCVYPPAINPSTGSVVTCWQTHGNASSTTYEVFLSTLPTYEVYTSSLVIVNDSLEAYHTLPFDGLTPNIRYYGKVVAFNGNNRASNPADLGAKHTLPNPPLALTPAAITMSGVKLTWNTNDNAAGTPYRVITTTQVDPGDDSCHYELGFTTSVPFSLNYTDSYFTATGLLTSTRYCFYVAAMNGDGETSGLPGTETRATTVAGPCAGASCAPTGSVGGTSDPSKLTTISGVLPNARAVAMDIPAGSFAAATGIAISSSSDNKCGQTLPISLRIYSESGAQPQVPVTLTFSYTQAEDAGFVQQGGNAPHIVLARYNPDSNECLPLETKLDTGNRKITATLNHFSDFQLIVRTAVTNLNSVRVFPNPFLVNRGNGYVTIDPVPANSKVRIYTLTGDKVWEGEAGTTGVIIWKGVNKSGELVASGIYLAVIDSSAGKKIKKIAVER